MHVLLLLELLLLLQVGLSLLEVFDIQVLLLFNFNVLFVESFGALLELHFYLFLSESQVILELLLSLLPLHHLISFDKDDVSQLRVHNFDLAVLLRLLVIRSGRVIGLNHSFKDLWVLKRHQLLTDIVNEQRAI